MSYNHIARCAQDGDLQQRLIACAAQEGHPNPNPQSFVLSKIWTIVSDPDIAEPYDYAVNSRKATPGKWDDVVNDGAILTVIQPLVQAEINPPAPPSQD